MTGDRTGDILLELGASRASATEMPRRLVQMCARSLPVSGVGLTLMSEGDAPAGLVAASDGVAVVLEELQFTLGEGPCVQASRSGRPVLVPDLPRAATSSGAGPVEWPLFAAAALESGVGAVFAFPLRIGAIRVGVLDLYREAAGELTAPDVAEALAYARAATTVLLHVQSEAAPQGPRDRGEPWTIPVLDDRTVVHQATGMVSVTAGVGMAEALLLLRARSYSEGRSINDVASDVVDGVLRLGVDAEEPPSGAT